MPSATLFEQLYFFFSPQLLKSCLGPEFEQGLIWIHVLSAIGIQTLGSEKLSWQRVHV